MLTGFDSTMSHTLIDPEMASIFTAVQDMLQIQGDSISRVRKSPKPANNKSKFRMSAWKVDAAEESLHYELLSMTLIRNNMAIVKVLQTPIDQYGNKRKQDARSPSLVIAKSGDEWEMVGLPLPRACLSSSLR